MPPHLSFDDVNAAPGDPSTSPAEDCLSPAQDSTAPEPAPLSSAVTTAVTTATSVPTAELPLIEIKVEEAGNARLENHCLVSSSNRMLASPLPPVASSRELWHFAIKCRLTKCKDIFSLGELLLFAIQTIPASLSLFLRTYTSFAMPTRGKDLSNDECRLRDLLPLPLPAMEKYSRWRGYDSEVQSRSSRGQYQRLQKFRKQSCVDLWN